MFKVAKCMNILLKIKIVKPQNYFKRIDKYLQTYYHKIIDQTSINFRYGALNITAEYMIISSELQSFSCTSRNRTGRKLFSYIETIRGTLRGKFSSAKKCT